jgi:hypothetical protein
LQFFFAATRSGFFTDPQSEPAIPIYIAPEYSLSSIANNVDFAVVQALVAG